METRHSELISRRRTFAIISHPDAGKTTLTEKLLLYGGAIQEAGAVKNRRAQRSAASDWMELEQQRGISVTSTVLQFEYDGYHLNLLDTPGHRDFSEDTYRTLTAADNALMLIDAAKGLEEQTLKLFEVCRLRGLPIFSFFNKLDRPGKGPFELIDEIEAELGLAVYPVTWPIGEGVSFVGIANRLTRTVHLYERSPRGRRIAGETVIGFADERLPAMLGEREATQLVEALELLDGAGTEFDRDAILQGKVSPAFFGSAMTNFGIEPFLDAFLQYSSPPVSRESSAGVIEPEYEDFTGFVFKLQANMDPRHRDCLAFIRICSGKFQKDMVVTNARSGKRVRLTRPQKLFARDLQSLEEAIPGDVIGLNNPGAFEIGDTIFTGPRIEFPGMPSFSPELFARLRNADAGSAKKFEKGMKQLETEGAVQVLHSREGRSSQAPVIAAVGELQFEVVRYRLKNEYGVETGLELLPFSHARWVNAGWAAIENGGALHDVEIFCDRRERPVLAFRNKWQMQRILEERPELELSTLAP
ncbi:MAG TPA: peptide chain release factor 3 [Aridibacter sp.]|nr:peptide chain release factor 3 [Aridibacter sp.]